MRDHLTTIYQSIQGLNHKGGAGNFAIFIADNDKNYYVQVVGEKGGTDLYTEAVSNNSISKDFKLSDSQIGQLKSMGWLDSKNGKGNYYQNWSISSDSDRMKVANFLLQTLTDIYSLSANEKLETNVVLE